MALLPLIPTQNFEVVRNQIATIIGVEMGAQYVMNNTYPNINQVWTERSVEIDPVNLDTECPTINVRLRKWKDTNSTITKVQRSLTFDIEIYTTAIASMTVAGDVASMLLMAKIAGMVSAILNYPDYDDLGLTGLISETCVERYYVADKGSVADALSGVVGILEFRVDCIEYLTPPDVSVPINELTCKVLMLDPNYGFFFDYKQLIIAVTTTGTTLTNSFLSNSIQAIDLLDNENNITNTYLMNVDFTITGTTATATTFTFTAGTNIIAKS